MMQNSRTQNYIRGLASGYAVTAVTILVGLWLTPYTLRFLDREQFAVFTLAGDILMWLGLFDIGFTSVLNVRAAQITGKPDQQTLDTLASTTFFVQIVIAVAIVAAGLVVSYHYGDFFAVRADIRRDAVSVFVLMLFGMAISVGTQTFSALLIAHQQIHIDNLLRIGLVFIRTGSTVLLLLAGYGLLALAWANLTATLITSFLTVYRVRRYLPGISINRRHFNWQMLRQTGGIGIWFTLGGAAGIVIVNLDRIVTAKMINVETVTTLVLTGRLYLVAWGLIQQVTNTSRPALAQIIGQGAMDEAQTKYHQLTLISTGMAIMAAASIWAGNGSFVIWWVGPHNYGGALLDGLLAFNLIVHAWVLPNRAILVAGLSSIPQNNISRFVEGTLNLTLSICLASVWGVAGVVLSTAIAGILTSCWYFPKLTAAFFGIELMPLLKKTFPNLPVLAVVSGLAAWIGRSVGNEIASISGALISSMICASLCLPFFWFYCLDSGTKQEILELVNHRLQRMKAGHL